MNNILFVSPNLSKNTGGKILSDNIFNALNKSFNVIIYTMKGYSDSRVKKSYMHFWDILMVHV